MLQQKDGKPRYLQAVSELSKAFALAVPHDSALEIRDEVGFFQEIRAVLAKSISEGGGKPPNELELAVRQIVSRAISSDNVIDIFDAASLKKPDISILSDEFLSEVQHLPQRNLAVELFSPDDPHPAAPPSPASASEGILVIVRRILRKYGYSTAR
jgi:type I restriction enzyme R subunit